jgi:hypothetical protein
MNNIKKETLLWVQVATLLGVWVAVLYGTGTTLAINWGALKKPPDAVTIYVVLSFVFTKWLWRLPLFKGWLVPFPICRELGRVNCKSTWKNPKTGQGIPPLRMLLVIRQTSSSISCTLLTKESESYSTAAQIAYEEETGALTLNYNYTNRSKVTIRHRSPIHDGATWLKIVMVPGRSLEGEYWTSRCTTGEMSLRFV